MNPLSLPNTAIALLVSAILSLTGGIYLGHNYTKKSYEAQIAKDSLERKQAYDKALEEQQAKNEKAVDGFVAAIRVQQAKNDEYQAQAKALYANQGLGMGGSTCRVSYGFIRLFNASASNSPSSPADSDSITSPIDLATVLSTVIENNGKYQDAAKQIEAIKSAQ